MATIYLVNDPLRPMHGAEKHEAAGVTIWQWLQSHFKGFIEFDQPTICTVNGEPCLRDQWRERELQANDVVHFVPMVQGIETIIIVALVAVVAAVAVTLISTTPQPSTPGRQDAGQPDPVFTFNGRKNQNRLGFPVESGYGLNRHFVSFAARPYTRYINNDSFFYGLYCLGHGEYDVKDIWIEDSQISNFQEAEAHIIAPGEAIAGFDNNVVTASEVGGIELFAPNEDSYPDPDGWNGPFIVNPAGTTTNRLEMDLVLPQGLYYANDQGGLTKWQVTYEVEFQKVDSNGDAVGDWIQPQESMRTTVYTRLIFPGVNGIPYASGWVLSGSATWGATDGMGDPGETITEFSDYDAGTGLYTTKTVKQYSTGGGYALRTNTTQRFTEEFIMPEAARWQVRARRTNNAGLSSRVVDKLVWERAKAYLPNVSDFGEKTLLAVKIRATNNLNDNSSQRINVWATRKLPIWDGEAWSEPTATRNPVWAMVDILKAQYGGRLGDEYLDLDTLKALADDFDSDGITFDWIYDQRSTIWEAAQAALGVGRAIPMLDGTQVIAVRDEEKTIPVYVFNQHNIVKDSFAYDIRLPGEDAYDALEVTYLNELERKEETVLCKLSDDPSTPINIEQVRIPGVTDRDQAYRLGLYLRAKRRYHTRNLTFRTGTEGHLPVFGDLIGVTHDLFSWGQGSFIVSVDDDTIELYEPFTFTEGETHQIVIRDKYGDILGPYTVTEGAHSKQIIAGETIPIDDLAFDNDLEPPLVQFGITNSWSKQLTVVRVKPAENDEFEITAVNYAPIIYTFDEETAPALAGAENAITAPDAPEIEALTVSPMPNTLTTVLVTWQVASTARLFTVQQSLDEGETWETITETISSFYHMAVTPGRVDVRVAATNKGQGPWAYWVGVGGLIRAVDNAQNTMTDDAGNIGVESLTA